MQLTLPVNYNYGDAKQGWTEEELRAELNIRSKQELKQIIKNCFSSYEEIYLSDERFSNLNVVSLRQSNVLEKDEDAFVFRFFQRDYSGVTKYFIETGQFAGFINYNGINIYISLSKRYNVQVLNHLLSYANNINVDSLPIQLILIIIKAN